MSKLGEPDIAAAYRPKTSNSFCHLYAGFVWYKSEVVRSLSSDLCSYLATFLSDVSDTKYCLQWFVNIVLVRTHHVSVDFFFMLVVLYSPLFILQAKKRPVWLRKSFYLHYLIACIIVSPYSRVMLGMFSFIFLLYCISLWRWISLYITRFCWCWTKKPQGGYVAE